MAAVTDLTSKSERIDRRHMQRAIDLARQGEGHYEEIFTEDHALYCSTDHPICLIPQDELTIEAVQEFDYVGWDYLESLAALRSSIELNSKFGTPHMEGLAMMILSGRYIAYLPTHYADQWVRGGKMWPILPSLTTRTVDVQLVMRKDLRHNRLIKRFNQFIRDSHENSSKHAA